MIKRFGRKTLSIFCALLIVLSVTVSVLTVSVGAAEPITQSFENITELKSVKYFSIYEATSADDTNVYDGSKSLKWTNGSGTDAVSFWQSGMDLTVGQLYKVEMYIKLTAANSNSMVLKQLSARDNGWTATGTDFTVDTSKLTVGEWSKYTLTFTAEQRAMGMYIYGTSDVYFDYFVYTPVTSDKVTVTLNANNGQSYDALSGTPGDAMALPTVTNDGMSFAGWYSDAELKTPFTDTAVFPEKNITLYAKWLPEGTVMQDFEVGYSISDSSSGFSVYTATGDDDTNVKDGTKSLKWTATSGSKVATLWCTGKDLTVGETYKMEAWIKAETSTGSGIKFTQLNDAKNGWSYANNTQFGLSYFGTNYDSIGEWKKFEVTFTAEKSAMGILIYGADNFYFDAITWTPVVADVTVGIEANNGQTVETLTGAPGSEMALPTVTKTGMSFAGWYTDAELKTPLADTTLFPDKNITLYAKWLPEGTVMQDFEVGYSISDANSGFSVYTATGDDDTNIKDGTKSLKWTHTSGTKVVTLWSSGKELTVGQTYKLEFWLKAASSTASSVTLTQLNDNKNGWAYGDNEVFALNYFGTGYDSVGEWKKFEITYTAQKEAMGIRIYGDDDFYFDAFKWTPLKEDVTVDFVTNNGTEVEQAKGASGMALQLPTLTKEGYYFAGWFTDAEFTEAFSQTTFPEASTTIYAKWIENGVITQNFESYDLTLSADSGFELYTASDENDENVYEGKHSLYRTNVNKTKVVSLSDKYTSLTVGKAYKVTYKIKITDLGTGGGLSLTNISVRNNPWSYKSFMSIGYIGSDYKHLNEWTEQSFVFIAENPYFGFSNWGNITYYVDDFKIVEVPIVTVSFEMGEGEAIEPMTGAAGATMKVDNPTPPEGKAFGGWYLDPEFTERYTISTFPEKDITLYARWIKEGTFEQDYETWPDKTGVYLTSNVFTLYTAEDENDPNVYHGKHSMLYDNPEGQNTYALGIFDTEMGKLTVGEKYYVSIRFKPVEMYSYSNINKTYTYHCIYYTTQQSNVWTYTSQGPQGKYVSSLFKDTYTEVGDEDWSGTSNLVTTTTSKDENGWLTMTYEIEAKAPYIALYMTGNYSMYIDYITIEPLPSGIISENYENSYCEDFYNILVEQNIAETPNNNETKIYKLELEARSDYIFTASLMKGVYGDCKVYLAWDEKGKNVVDGTVFNGNGTDYKLYSSRIMTDFTGILYLVVEGAGPGSCDYFALFKTKYGCEEDPNPYYVHPTVNYNTLPQKVASTDTLDISTDDDGSPLTGDKGVLLPCILLCVTAVAVLVILRKRGAENEK